MKIYLALPVLNESANLPALLENLKDQSFGNFELFVCVNQPNHYWDDPAGRAICRDNRKSMELLQGQKSFRIHLIDRSSAGNAWKGKHFGVGWARKTLMDAINQEAGKDDLIISIDADTFYPPEYLDSVIEVFEGFPTAHGLANPYYHPLSGDENIDKAILHYEIYMRNYNINMLLIDNPYSFTALGSAMSVPVWAYRKVGGITPHKSGEDFYFLQKLRKSGDLLSWNRIPVFPSARASDRVFFGTGPAIIRGLKNDWQSYPVYHHRFFEEIKEVYENFFSLYTDEMDSPVIEFLKDHLKDPDFLKPLRGNASSPASFSKAMFRKIDALRILQYLKHRQLSLAMNNTEALTENILHFGLAESIDHKQIRQAGDLLILDPLILRSIRDELFNLESMLQQKSQSRRQFS